MGHVSSRSGPRDRPDHGAGHASAPGSARPRTQPAAGEVSFDRIEAVSRIQDDVGLMLHAWFLVMQPTLDESWGRLWGGLDGLSGAIVDKVLPEAADALPALPDGELRDLGWRKATALVGCLGSVPTPTTPVVVLVEARCQGHRR